MNDTVTIVDPAAEDSAVAETLAPRIGTLAGAHVGVIDNSKHMAGELLAQVEVLLQQRYGVKKVTRYRKANASIPTPPDVLASLTASCDAIAHGVAD